jgi:O-antigen/teichoic acid export membrane protein
VLLAIPLGPLAARWLLHERDPAVGILATGLMLILLLGIPSRLVTVALSGSRRMEEVSYYENLAAVQRTLLVLAGVGASLLLAPTGSWQAVTCIVAARLVAAAGNSVAALLLYRRWRRRYAAKARADVDLPALREILPRVRRVPLRKDLGFSVWIGLDKNFAVLVTLIPYWILGWSTTDETRKQAQGFLHGAMRILSFPLMALTAVSRNTLLKLGERQGARDPAGAWRVFRQVTVVSGLFSLAVVVPLAVLAPWIIRVVAGPGFEAEVPCLRILAIYAAVQGFAAGLGSLFIVRERLRASMLLKLVGVAIVLPVGLWLCRTMAAPEQAVSVYHVLQQGLIVLLAFVYVGLTLRPTRAA